MAQPIQEPLLWEEEITDEELSFLEEFMPHQLEAKALELEKSLEIDQTSDRPVPFPSGDRIQLDRAA